MDWQLPSKATELLWMLAKCEITSEILPVERVRHFVTVFQYDNFIHRYSTINIRYILFGCYLNLFMPCSVCVSNFYLKDRIYIYDLFGLQIVIGKNEI